MSQYQGRRSATSSQAASYQPTKGYTYGGGTAYTHTEEGAAFRKNKRRGGYEQSTQSNSGYMPRQQASSSTYEDEGLRYPHSCQKSEHFTQSVTTSKIESSSPSKQASNYQGTDQYQQSFGVANDSASNHYYGHENHYAEDVSSDQYSCQQNAQRKQSQLYGDDSRHGYKCKSKISETSNRRDSHLGPKNSQVSDSSFYAPEQEWMTAQSTSKKKHQGQLHKHIHPSTQSKQQWVEEYEYTGHALNEHSTSYSTGASHSHQGVTHNSSSQIYPSYPSSSYCQANRRMQGDRSQNVLARRQVAQRSIKGTSYDIEKSHCQEGDHAAIPVWQQGVLEYRDYPEHFDELSELQSELFALAEEGDLLIEIEDLVEYLQSQSQTSSISQLNEQGLYDLLDYAEDQELIHLTRRNFGSLKALCFVSLNLGELSCESLAWVLQSLKRDEMCPTERAVQSRIKEAFSLKIGTTEWERIIQGIEKGQEQIMESSNCQTENALKENPFRFEVIEIEEDPAIGQMTKAIYPLGQQRWSGVDQKVDEIEEILYMELKSFLEEYFCQDWESAEQIQTYQEHHNQKVPRYSKKHQVFQTAQTIHSELNFSEVRAIPGGRYGCAQFIKICGPSTLRASSLGRLAQLVQHAVKEDVLRYHKTLLVWTAAVDKHKKKSPGGNSSKFGSPSKSAHQSAESKLNLVKSALIEILTENRSGMSLAQLPLFLRRKLQFTLDLNELGFPKLKDLILSMPERIKLELRGHNHPFACLVRQSPQRQVINQTASANIKQIVSDFEFMPIEKTQVAYQPKTADQNSCLKDLEGTIPVKETLLVKEDSTDNLGSATTQLEDKFNKLQLQEEVNDEANKNNASIMVACDAPQIFINQCLIPPNEVKKSGISPFEHDKNFHPIFQHAHTNQTGILGQGQQLQNVQITQFGQSQPYQHQSHFSGPIQPNFQEGIQRQYISGPHQQYRQYPYNMQNGQYIQNPSSHLQVPQQYHPHWSYYNANQFQPQMSHNNGVASHKINLLPQQMQQQYILQNSRMAPAPQSQFMQTHQNTQQHRFPIGGYGQVNSHNQYQSNRQAIGEVICTNNFANQGLKSAQEETLNFSMFHSQTQQDRSEGISRFSPCSAAYLEEDQAINQMSQFEPNLDMIEQLVSGDDDDIIYESKIISNSPSSVETQNTLPTNSMSKVSQLFRKSLSGEVKSPKKSNPNESVSFSEILSQASTNQSSWNQHRPDQSIFSNQQDQSNAAFQNGAPSYYQKSPAVPMNQYVLDEWVKTQSITSQSQSLSPIVPHQPDNEGGQYFFSNPNIWRNQIHTQQSYQQHYTNPNVSGGMR